ICRNTRSTVPVFLTSNSQLIVPSGMALSMLFHSHGLVKDEDDYEIQFNEPLDHHPLMETGDAVSCQSSPVDDYVDEIKAEIDDQIVKEEEVTPTLPMSSGVSAGLPPSCPLVPPKEEEHPIKEEPLDHEDYQPPIASDATASDHPEYGIAALLSLAGQDTSKSVQQLAFDLFTNVPKEEEIDDDVKDIPLLPQSSSNLHLSQLPSSSFLEGSGDHFYGIKFVPILPRRGRPMGTGFREEQVANDPIKRRQQHNRAAALRYREKKKMEAWERQNEENCRQEMNMFLMERVDDLNREIHAWKRRCLREFNFLPEYDFEDHSPIPFPLSSRLSCDKEQSEERNEGVSPHYDRLTQNRMAAARLREKKRKAQDLLKVEEAELTARNEVLRSEALQLYLEVVNLRKKMGLDKTRTSADRELPILLRSSQFTSDQISEYLAATQ
ncbi:hypothetical protein PMAYCL1PPCAC_30745, partial [Pristionchus mayeri]